MQCLAAAPRNDCSRREAKCLGHRATGFALDRVSSQNLRGHLDGHCRSQCRHLDVQRGFRLAAEGTSFTALADETRREFAQHHLANTKLSTPEIAYLLGYAEQGTFFRASNRWFGASSGEDRARVVQGHSC